MALALRCDLPSAMLACTVYAAAPAGAEAGLQRRLVAHSLTAAAQCLEAFLSQDQQGSKSRTCALAGAGAGRVGSCEHGAAEGGACSSSDEGGEDEPSLPVDDYLGPPPSRVRLASPLLTYVAVPALPRGAQVEFQPVALRRGCAGGLPTSPPGMSISGRLVALCLECLSRQSGDTDCCLSMGLLPPSSHAKKCLDWCMVAGGLDGVESDWQAQLEGAEIRQSVSANLAAVRAVRCYGDAAQVAACGSCVFVHGCMCRAHLWMPLAVQASCAAELGDAVGGNACEDMVMGACIAAGREALEAAGLGHTQILCMRVYYRKERFQQSRLEAALTRAWGGARGGDTAEAPPAAFVPVLAVGPTADADAALLVELVATTSSQEPCA